MKTRRFRAWWEEESCARDLAGCDRESCALQHSIINYSMHRGDNGRVLGYDMAHGFHHQPLMGKVEKIDFPGYENLSDQFLKEVAALRNKREIMKKLTIHTDGFEGFRKRSLKRARKLDRGELLEPEKILTFESARVLTRARLVVFRKVKEKEISITALATSLKRKREAVSRDVMALKNVGLVKVREVSNPGHGRVVMVSPAAKKILVEI